MARVVISATCSSTDFYYSTGAAHRCSGIGPRRLHAPWIGVGAKGATFDRIKSWEPLFRAIGLDWIREGGGRVDIAPLAASGAILMSLVPDSQRYFDVHHSGIDVLEKVNSRELELGGTAMALLAWLLAQEGTE